MKKERTKLFGTDGIRGVANKYPMTAEIAMKFAMAAAHYFKVSGRRNRVVIAKDTRLSGYLIEPALTAGFISMGIDVTLVGPMPTPSVPLLIKSLRADLGVMISASHNEYTDNGLKLFDNFGKKLCDETQYEIESLIHSPDLHNHMVDSKDLGRALRLEDAPGRYIESAKYCFLKGKTLSGKKIVVDSANGAAYKIAPTIFWELGAEVIKLASEPNGCNINDDCGSTRPNNMSAAVTATKADLGIALDGDADRVIMCDENGEVLTGDHLIGIIATSLLKRGKLKGGTVVITQMSNQALEDYLLSLNLKVVRTQVGDRYVSSKMCELGCNFGGEQSGHLILADYSSTGDGIIAAIEVLNYLITNNLKASEITKLFTPKPQVLQNIKFSGTDNPLDKSDVRQKLEQLQKNYSDYRFVIRKSGTESKIRIMIEGPNEKEIDNAMQVAVSILS